MKGKSLIFSLIMGGFCLSASAQKVVFDFNGKVTDSNGQGIAGVVVNDGISFTKTDAQGAWALVSDTTRSKFVSISVPASCVLPQQDGLAFCVGKTEADGRAFPLYSHFRPASA